MTRSRSIAIAIACAVAGALTAPLAQAAPKVAPPVRFILVGDSTMAQNSGWGPAFCADVVPEATCVNMAKGGRSSGSYRAEGSWATTMAELAKPGPWKKTYVLVQFGHNDQPGKPGRSTDFATEYPVNLTSYVSDIRAAGATPVLVTPLTRRQFREGVLLDGLSAWAAATRKVAARTNTALLDLNADSVIAVQTLGPVEAMSLAMAPPPEPVREAAANGTTVEVNPPRAMGAAPAPTATAAVERQGAAKSAFDYTHIGPKGASLFAGMVEDELFAVVPGLRGYFKRR
ncbi:MAG: lysophospholipase [Caulobacter sp.]|nr:lysophospholipase [Caulobacter sp.]